MQTAWKRRQATTRVANTKVTVDYATVSPPIPLGARSHPGAAVSGHVRVIPRLDAAGRPARAPSRPRRLPGPGPRSPSARAGRNTGPVPRPHPERSYLLGSPPHVRAKIRSNERTRPDYAAPVFTNSGRRRFSTQISTQTGADAELRGRTAWSEPSAGEAGRSVTSLPSWSCGFDSRRPLRESSTSLIIFDLLFN